MSGRESGTARLITVHHLKGLALDEGAHRAAGHGVVGVPRGGRPGDRVVALRADIDVLPVPDLCDACFASQVVDEDYPGGPFPVSYACGPDYHTAMLLGTATVLTGVRERLPGTVLFAFQPAEEGPPVDEKGGARQIVAEGALGDPAPPWSSAYTSRRTRRSMSATGSATSTGGLLPGQDRDHRQVHSSTPWQGIDPMPAPGAILTGVGQLYHQLSAFDPATVTIGHVEDVGRFNIVGETVTLWGTVRCSVESDMADVQERLTRLATHTARAYGCTSTVDYVQDVLAVHNRGPWVDAALLTFRRVAGADKVAATGVTLGYDDVSEFVNMYGGLYVMLGVQDVGLDAHGHPVPTPGGRSLVLNHNPHFYADDASLAMGVRLHTHVAHDHLTGILTVG